MKNIITELYYGNIDPQARGFIRMTGLSLYAMEQLGIKPTL